MQPNLDHTRLLLGQIPWFSALPEAARATLLSGCTWHSIPGGEVLFHEGETADAAYLVLSGSFAAFCRTDSGHERMGLIVMGETVGELGVLTQLPRNATVRALRDSEVLRIPAPHLEKFGAQFPQALVALSQLALRRAGTPQDKQYQKAAPRTLALLNQNPGIDLIGFAQTLKQSLSRFGSVRILTVADKNLLPAQYQEIESQVRFVLYVANSDDALWRNQCRRQADALLLIAQAANDPDHQAEVLLPHEADNSLPSEHLILLHNHNLNLGAGRRWRSRRETAQLHHVCNKQDIARVARLLCGQSLGLVLSGGGARGFAHIGIIKALIEAGFEIDAVGGTSIGAVIGAGLAAGWSIEEMTEKFRYCFYDTNPLSDYTLPLVSMVSGRKASRLFREIFGVQDIEDLLLPYFCVSANLTSGKAVAHRQGPLWQWLRASSAIPGILPPVCSGGEVFVDGGVINNLPVDVMRSCHPGEIIAADIGGTYAITAKTEEFDLPPFWQLAGQFFQSQRRPSLSQILLRAGMVNSSSATLEARNLSSLLLTPGLEDIGLLEWKSFYHAIDRGYQYTLRIVGGRKDALSELSSGLF